MAITMNDKAEKDFERKVKEFDDALMGVGLGLVRKVLKHEKKIKITDRNFDRMVMLTTAIKRTQSNRIDVNVSGTVINTHTLSPELSEMVNAVLSNSTASFATKPTNGNGKKNGGRKK